MPRSISEELRGLVANCAEHRCEYYLIHEEDTFFGCEVNHLIRVKHGGPTDADDLAYACVFGNRQKGSDIGSISQATGDLPLRGWRIHEG